MSQRFLRDVKLLNPCSYSTLYPATLLEVLAVSLVFASANKARTDPEECFSSESAHLGKA